jgi:hypothetical protein
VIKNRNIEIALERTFSKVLKPIEKYQTAAIMKKNRKTKKVPIPRVPKMRCEGFSDVVLSSDRISINILFNIKI